MQIRKATKKDIPACAEILKKEFSKQGEPWTSESAKKRLFDLLRMAGIGLGKAFVLVENKKIIGFVFSELLNYEQGKIIWVAQFAITAEEQGKGYGTKTLEFLENLGRKKGIKTIMLGANKNEKSYRIYKKKGFKKTHFVFLEKTID